MTSASAVLWLSVALNVALAGVILHLERDRNRLAKALAECAATLALAKQSLLDADRTLREVRAEIASVHTLLDCVRRATAATYPTARA